MTAASPRADAKVIAGRFRLLSELGAGGFGQVFRAEDLHANGALRAVKTLKPNVNVADLAKRFEEEARALSSLKHAGVPKCWDFGEDESFGSYFVLDYIEGQTLLDRIEKGGMPLEERFQRAIEFFDVLDHVHNRGILHRDIKPENLMVPRSGGHLILLDFGIAKDLAQSAVHTATGVILGTPYYLTPEQLSGERYTARSDLYQAALLTYWLLTGGVHCFVQVDSVAQLLVQRQMVPRAGALERTSWYGRARGHMDLLLRCLEPNPSNRPGTARVVHDALVAVKEAALGTGSAPAPTTDGVAAPVKKASGRVVQPTAVAQATGVKTAEVERSSVGAMATTPGGVPLPATRSPDPVSQSLRVVSAIIAVTAIGVGVVITMQARSIPRVTHSPSPMATSSAVVDPPASEATSAVARELITALKRARLDESWLRKLGAKHRPYLGKDQQRVGSALRGALDEVGVASALDRFLVIADRYFKDESVSSRERWLVKSALCDLELLEFFCDEHSIPWSFASRISTHTATLAREVDVGKIDLTKASTWGRFGKSARQKGLLADRTASDSWSLPKQKFDKALVVWYRLKQWRPALVLDVRFGGEFRTLLHQRPGAVVSGMLAVTFADMIAHGKSLGPYTYTPKPDDGTDNSFLGFQVPRFLWSDNIVTSVESVYIPETPPSASSPSIYQRFVSVVPVSAANAASDASLRAP